jgi:hypothetical protein
LAAGLWGAAPHAPWAADVRPVLSIVDGEASASDGLHRESAAEGLRLAPGTLLDTGPRCELLRLEWANGQVLDLGPATRAMVAPPPLGPRDRPGAVLYLLAGWAKLRAAPKATASFLMLGCALGPFPGVALAGVTDDEQLVFAEGAAVPLARRGAAGSASIVLASGDAYLSAAGAHGEMLANPPLTLMRRIPRSLRDTLPLRWSRVIDAPPKTSPLPAPTYAELAPWLQAEPGLRREFARRLAGRAREPVFRAALLAKLQAHPEWQPVLFPPPPPSPPSYGPR